MNGIVISFVLPWFHKLELFKRAITFNQPIFSQPGCEVVIAMDESSEEGELVKLLPAWMPTIKWRVVVNDQKHPWRPPCKAINVGIRHAYGDWIAVLSPETFIDLPKPDMLLVLASAERKSFYNGHLRFVKNVDMDEPFVPTDTCGYGFLFCPKSWLEAVNGYAENRERWGGDDDDLQVRLQKTCGNKVVLSSIHLTHPEHQHLWPFERVAREPIGDQMPEHDWGRDFDRVALDWFKPNEVFDGSYSCLVPMCCEGKVVQVQRYEAPAFKYMVGAPLLADQHFICQHCRKVLPSVRKPERVRKKLNIK